LRGRLLEFANVADGGLQVAVDAPAGRKLVADARGNPREPHAAAPDASAATATDDAATNAATATDDAATNDAATAATTNHAAAATTATSAAATTRGERRVGAGRQDDAGHGERAERISKEQSAGRENPSQILANHLIASKFFLRQWKPAGGCCDADTRVTLDSALNMRGADGG
jgi:hypothetical protein